MHCGNALFHALPCTNCWRRPRIYLLRRLTECLRAVLDGVSAAIHASVAACVIAAAALAVRRLLSAIVRPRAAPAAAFAPLSHMLSIGFFLSQGFFICIPCGDEQRLLPKCRRNHASG